MSRPPATSLEPRGRIRAVGAVQCSAVQCKCSAVQCSAVQCSAVQCSAVQCSAVQCSARLRHMLRRRRLHDTGDVAELSARDASM